MRALLTAGAALLALGAVALADDLTPERRRELEKKADELSEAGGQHYQRGEYDKARESFREALELRRTLYPKKDYPRGHAHLAAGINNLATLHMAMGEYAEAEPLCREALDMDRALFPRDKY